MLLDDRIWHNDPEYGGYGYIAGESDGVVTVDGVPSERQVLLFERRKFKLVRAVWSDSQGFYRFNYLNPDKEFLMVALDYKKQYEPVSYDFVKPYVDKDE